MFVCVQENENRGRRSERPGDQNRRFVGAIAEAPGQRSCPHSMLSSVRSNSRSAREARSFSERRNVAAALSRALLYFPEAQREVAVLKLVRGARFAEIGEIARRERGRGEECGSSARWRRSAWSSSSRESRHEHT